MARIILMPISQVEKLANSIYVKARYYCYTTGYLVWRMRC